MTIDYMLIAKVIANQQKRDQEIDDKARVRNRARGKANQKKQQVEVPDVRERDTQLQPQHRESGKQETSGGDNS